MAFWMASAHSTAFFAGHRAVWGGGIRRLAAPEMKAEFGQCRSAKTLSANALEFVAHPLQRAVSQRKLGTFDTNR